MYNIASQVWMALSRIMTDEENKEIMESMIDRLFPVKDIAMPYMYHHIVEALFEAVLKKDAVELMKNYWGKYESLIVNSYCHAWGCTPVYLIRKYCI